MKLKHAAIMQDYKKRIAIYPVKQEFDFLVLLKWIANIVTIIGAFFVAFHGFIFGYVLFLIGASLWLFVAYKNDDFELAFLQVFFIMANLAGLVKAL